ncbi:hypothetical protein [Pararhodobacter sp.]|nr:hypothetical protein [Pararhodobacter sp.]
MSVDPEPLPIFQTRAAKPRYRAAIRRAWVSGVAAPEISLLTRTPPHA